MLLNKIKISGPRILSSNERNIHFFFLQVEQLYKLKSQNLVDQFEDRDIK